jgi:hypothetical protein
VCGNNREDKAVPFNEVVHGTTTKLGNHSKNEYLGGFGTHLPQMVN